MLKLSEANRILKRKKSNYYSVKELQLSDIKIAKLACGLLGISITSVLYLLWSRKLRAFWPPLPTIGPSIKRILSFVTSNLSKRDSNSFSYWIEFGWKTFHVRCIWSVPYNLIAIDFVIMINVKCNSPAESYYRFLTLNCSCDWLYRRFHNVRFSEGRKLRT